MGQVEKIFVVSIVGLVLLILAITVFGPSHQGAQACIVPPGTQKAGVENPLHPEGPAGAKGEEAGRDLEEEIPAAVVVKGGEAVPAVLPGTPETPPAEEALAPKKEETPALPPREKPAPPSEPAPKETQPAPAPQAPSYRPKPAVPYVVVQKGETFGEILIRELGSARKYRDLVLQFNEGMDPDHLRVGQKIWLPPSLLASRGKGAAARASAPAVKKSRPAPPPSRTYQVKKGDSLWKIASRFFGKKRVLEGIRRIKRANPDKDLDLLPAGIVLVIPR